MFFYLFAAERHGPAGQGYCQGGFSADFTKVRAIFVLHPKVIVCVWTEIASGDSTDFHELQELIVTFEEAWFLTNSCSFVYQDGRVVLGGPGSFYWQGERTECEYLSKRNSYRLKQAFCHWNARSAILPDDVLGQLISATPDEIVKAYYPSYFLLSVAGQIQTGQVQGSYDDSYLGKEFWSEPYLSLWFCRERWKPAAGCFATRSNVTHLTTGYSVAAGEFSGDDEAGERYVDGVESENTHGWRLCWKALSLHT